METDKIIEELSDKSPDRLPDTSPGDRLKARLPEWAKRPLGQMSKLHEMKSVLRKRGLSTVCESARCPNIGECFTRPTATFLILGDRCTRNCGFCSVPKDARPLPLKADEPGNIAITVAELNLKHVVITSVTRDDLADGGAAHFASTIRAVRTQNPKTSIEVLTPDFGGSIESLEVVLDAGPDIFNHNVETVPSLYSGVRAGANYKASLALLRHAAGYKALQLTKSGIMVGLGETRDEVRGVLLDLNASGVDIVTIGQYLRPTRRSLEVREYLTPDVFEEYKVMGQEAGIAHVYSGTFVRSSYNAEEVFKATRKSKARVS